MRIFERAADSSRRPRATVASRHDSRRRSAKGARALRERSRAHPPSDLRSRVVPNDDRPRLPRVRRARVRAPPRPRGRGARAPLRSRRRHVEIRAEASSSSSSSALDVLQGARIVAPNGGGDGEVRDSVVKYYGETLTTSDDLKTSACCTPNALPSRVRDILSKVPDEVKAKYYGCGSPTPSGSTDSASSISAAAAAAIVTSPPRSSARRAP